MNSSYPKKKKHELKKNVCNRRLLNPTKALLAFWARGFTLKFQPIGDRCIITFSYYLNNFWSKCYRILKYKI